MNTVDLPNEIHALKTLVFERDAAITERDAAIEELNEKVRLLTAQLYQPKSEKSPKVHMDQHSLFDEAEVIAQKEDVLDGEVVQVPAHSRKKRGRRPIPEEFPRVDVVHDIPEEDKTCPCGCVLSRIGEEISEKLSIVPQKIEVVRHVRPKYACKNCEGVEDEGPTVKIAPMPPQLIKQGIVTPSLLAYIFIAKFADGLPFYRQNKMFERLGVDISRATMSGWTLRAAKACEPLVELLLKEIRSGPIINMDETPVQVLSELGRKNTSKSYMWVMRGGPPEAPVLLYQYAPGRGGAVASELVGDFEGYLQVDGYAGYNALCERPDITRVGCMVHVRRKFKDVGKNSTKNKSGVAATVLNLISKLYAVEKEARKKGLRADQIYELRQEKSCPIMEKIHKILLKYAKSTAPKSTLGKAISYALGQWPFLEVYLEDGRLSLDNNAAENAIRPFAIGRKNWLFSGSPAGANASAAMYSLIETAKANGLNPFEYLLHVFEKLPYAASKQELEALLPRNYTSSSPAKTDSSE